MGGAAVVPKHIFLILLLALSLAGMAYSANCTCSTAGKLACEASCPNGPSQCCSGFCSSSETKCVACVQPGESGCSNSSDCCSGNLCKSGACTSCECDSKVHCGYSCPNGDSDCCSGLCSSEKVCVACIPATKTCSAQGTCCGGLDCTGGVCGGPAIGGGSGDWAFNLFAWTGAAVIMAATFLGLAYMAAKAFELQMLEAWVRVEVGELMKSMVIAFFCITLIASTNIASQFLSGGTGDMITSAQASLKVMYVDAQALYMKLAVAYFNLSKVASYSYMAGTSAAGYFTISYNSAPGSGLSPLVGETGQALDAVASYMLLAATQAAFLQFFATASVVMLPIGIFLRSFSFTRRLGGTLLAATIGASVIFPTSVLLSGEVYKTFQPDIKAGTEKIVVKAAENPPSPRLSAASS